MAVNFFSDSTFNCDNFIITSGSTGKPEVFITTTGNNNKPSVLTFRKDKGAAGADADGIGGIAFVSDNDAQQQTTFGSILYSVESATDGQEEGKINIGVAALNSGGNNSANVLQGVGNGQNVTDVTIGLGATNVTTIAGTLTMGSTATLDNSGNLLTNAATATALTAGDKTISGDLTVTSGTSGDATLIISADTDNSEEGDSPRLWFKADGDITQGAIQHNDNTFDFISNVSANGGFRFLTGTTNNTGTTDPSNGATERLSIDSTGMTISGSIQLGHASDTTIARASAGKVTIEGNEIQTTNVHHHFLNSGFYLSYAYARYIPLNGSITEQNVPGSTPEYTGFIWPYDGYVKTIWVRSEADSGNTIMQLYKGTNGNANGGTAMGSVTEACGAHTSVEFDFTGVTNSFSQGEGMAIKIDPTNTSQGVIVTIECVFNLTT